MKTALTRSPGLLPALLSALLPTLLAALLLVGAGAAAAGMPGAGFPSSILGALAWLLAVGGGACCLLRHGIEVDDQARDTAARLCLEQKARRALEAALADTQSALTRVVRQQEGVRDVERNRIARAIRDDLGQTLLALRAEMALLQVASCGIHPATHQKTTAMIGTLDLALGSLRILAGETRHLAAGADLGRAVAEELDAFTRLHGIAHRLEIVPPNAPAPTEPGLDALLYRALQDTLASIADAACATEVRVRLARSAASLALSIEDDGGPDGVDSRLQASLRQRLRAAGGYLQAAPTPGGATRIAMVLPGAHGLVPG